MPLPGGRIGARPTLVVAAALLALLGPVPMALWLALAGLAYAARSPDRLLDATFVALFCAMGALAGRG